MTVRLDEGTIRLEGDCRADEAEALLELLLFHPNATIDWSGCHWAHTAVVQVLLAAGRPVSGIPEDAFIRQRVLPMLSAAGRDANAPEKTPHPGAGKRH